MSQQITIQDVVHEHYELVRRERSPVIAYVEAYYIRHSELFSPRKIREIGIFSSEEAEHVITHVSMVLATRKKQRRNVRKVSFGQFYTDQTIKEVRTPRLRYFRDKLDKHHKVWIKTGRFAPYSAQEQRIISQQRVKNITPAQPKAPQTEASAI